MKKLMQTAVAAALIAGATLGYTHTIWLEPDADEPGTFEVLFGGHAGMLEPLEPDKIQSLRAIDSGGNAVNVQRARTADGLRVSVPPSTAMVVIHFDNGIWSRGPMGRSLNLPMNQVDGASTATHAVKYHKSIVSWSEVITEPLQQEFEVVPLDARQPLAGEPMRVRVLFEGKPLAGVKLGHGEEGDLGPTNPEGEATVVPEAGFNRLWAGKRFPVREQTHTQVSYEYLMVFEARERR